MMGGVKANLTGRTNLERLWVCGEVARTGVHGANRLASNSLLEGLVFAERVAADALSIPRLVRAPRSVSWSVPVLTDRGAAQVAAESIRDVMWRHAGIDRTAQGLVDAVDELSEIIDRLPEGATEEANLADTAFLIVSAALQRQESRGGHFRRDFPRSKNKWRGRHIEF
jgi:L-aspartate oxidase